MIIAFLVTLFLVPLFSWFGIPTRLDTTIWVGSLSFEGALAIGIVAITSWIAKMTVRIFPAFIDSAIEYGLVNRPVDVSDDWSLSQNVEEKISKNSPEIEQYAVQLTISDEADAAWSIADQLGYAPIILKIEVLQP